MYWTCSFVVSKLTAVLPPGKQYGVGPTCACTITGGYSSHALALKRPTDNARGILYIRRRYIIAQLRKARIAPRKDKAMRCKGKGVVLSEGDSSYLDLRGELGDRGE